MSKQPNLVKFASVIKTHGLKGELSIYLSYDLDKSFKIKGPLFLSQVGIMVPFFVTNFSFFDSKGILKLEDIDSIDQAKKMIGTEIFIDEKYIEESDSEISDFSQLVGFEIQDSTYTTSGKIVSFVDLPNNSLFEIEISGTLVLLPANTVFIKEIDMKKKIMKTSFPEGLIEVYLGSDKEDISDL